MDSIDATGRTMADRTVLGEAAVLRVAGLAVVLALLWLAVAWAVAVP